MSLGSKTLLIKCVWCTLLKLHVTVANRFKCCTARCCSSSSRSTASILNTVGSCMIVRAGKGNMHVLYSHQNGDWSDWRVAVCASHSLCSDVLLWRRSAQTGGRHVRCCSFVGGSGDRACYQRCRRQWGASCYRPSSWDATESAAGDVDHQLSGAHCDVGHNVTRLCVSQWAALCVRHRASVDAANRPLLVGHSTHHLPWLRGGVGAYAAHLLVQFHRVCAHWTQVSLWVASVVALLLSS